MRACTNGFLGSLSRFNNGRLSSPHLQRPCASIAARASPISSLLRPRQWRRLYAQIAATIQTQDSITTADPSASAQRKVGRGRFPEKTWLGYWLAKLDDQLPQHLRSVASSSTPYTQPKEDNANRIASTLIRARKQNDLDILVHLGMVEGRWEAIEWIINALLKSNTGESKQEHPVEDGLSNLLWPKLATLDLISDQPLSCTFDKTEHGTSISSLGNFTNDAPTLVSRPDNPTQSQVIGQIWISIGNFFLDAAATNAEDCDAFISKVLPVVAKLRSKGHVPSDIHMTVVDEETFSLRQTPLMLLPSLSGDKGQSENAATTIQSKDDDERKLATKPTNLPKLGPDSWFEFVLWCCLQSGLTMEGAYLLKRMRKFDKRTRTPWTLVCVKEAVEDVDAPLSQQGSTAEAVLRKTLIKPRSAVQRNLNSEVVVAYVEGLLAKVTHSSEVASTEYTLKQVLEAIFPLKDMLRRHRMSLGLMTWDAIISRFAVLPEMDLERWPRSLERTLELTVASGLEAGAVNVPRAASQDGGTLSYVFEGSATVLGLYHRLLHSHIKSRDMEGTLRVLSRLQLVTDANKKKALENFFQKLQDVNSSQDEVFLNLQDWSLGAQCPALYPDIPVHILADLLDLITESGAHSVGQWLLHSQDVDGPLVSIDQYGHPLLSPSLIRFAAAISDTGLLSAITRSPTTAFSGGILVALCESRIRKGEWKGTYDILALMRDNYLYAWTTYDMVMIIRALILHIHSPPVDRSLESATSNEASIILQRLLRGDLGQVWGPRFSNLDTIVGILSSVHRGLADLLSNLLARGGWYTADLSSPTFDVLLDGVVKAYGSAAGQKLVELWCKPDVTRREINHPSFNEEYTQRTPSVAFGLEGISPSPSPNVVTFSGFISLKLPAVRIIVQQALREDRGRGTLVVKEDGEQAKHEFQSHPVLDWAADYLRDQHGLSNEDIDYELDGYLAATGVGPTKHHTYEHTTLDMWRALGESRREWVTKQEDLIRRFAISKTEDRLQLEPAPPAERFFCQSMAHDFGLATRSTGEGDERAVVVYQTSDHARIPSRTLSEVVGGRRFSGNDNA